MNSTMKLLPLAVGSALLLAACGGGSDSNNSSNTSNNSGTPTAQSLGPVSGTVATGAPLEDGQVTLKDGKGNMIVTAVDDSGAYKADLSKFTAPVVIEANGVVAGNPVSLHSVALQAGTVNVTPLTDAIVGMAAGTSADACFSGLASCGSSLTQANINQSQSNLQATLAPVLAAAGVNGQSSLITTKFAADKTGMDKVLESVDVQAGANAGEISVTNKLTGDSATVSAKAKPAALPKTTLPDLSGMDAIAAKLTAAYKSADGLSDRLKALLSKGFAADGMTAEQFLAVEQKLASGADKRSLLNSVFSRPVIHGCSKAGNGNQVCDVGMTVRDGKRNASQFRIQLEQQNGVWLLAGNNQPVRLSTSVYAKQAVSNGNSQLEAGLSLRIPTQTRAGSVLGAVTKVAAQSAELLVGQNVLAKLTNQCGAAKSGKPAADVLVLDNSCNTDLVLNDQQIASYNSAIAKKQVKLRVFSDSNFATPIGSDLPLTQALFSSSDLKKLALPQIDKSVLAKAANADGSTELTVSWTLPAKQTLQQVSLDMKQQIGTTELQRIESNKDNQVQFPNTIVFKAAKNAKLTAPQSLSLSVSSLDRSGRTLSSVYKLR